MGAGSQGGESAEAVRLLKTNRGKSPIIAITNTPGSPLAAQADAAILTQAGREFSVSCKTYLTALMALKWLEDILCERAPRRRSPEHTQARPPLPPYLPTC